MRNQTGGVYIVAELDEDIWLTAGQQRCELLTISNNAWSTTRDVYVELPESDEDGYFMTVFWKYGECPPQIRCEPEELSRVTIAQGNCTQLWVDTTGVRSLDAMFAPVSDPV